jgi:hypothetical protein
MEATATVLGELGKRTPRKPTKPRTPRTPRTPTSTAPLNLNFNQPNAPTNAPRQPFELTPFRGNQSNFNFNLNRPNPTNAPRRTPRFNDSKGVVTSNATLNRSRRVTPGDISKGDVIKFSFETNLFSDLIWGSAYNELKGKIAQEMNLNDVGLDRKQAWGGMVTIYGSGQVIGDISIAPHDMARRLANIAKGSGFTVYETTSSPLVEIQTRAEETSNYRAPSQIPNVNANDNNGGNNNGGNKDDKWDFDLSKLFPSGMSTGVILALGLVAVIAVKGR